MAQQIQIKGYILPDAGCGDGCAGVAPAQCAWELDLLSSCGESYQNVRQFNYALATLPGEFLDLVTGFAQVELLALRSSGPITLRVNGEPARALTNAIWPLAGLDTLTLGFSVDALAVAVTFVAGDDTPAEVAARINAAAALVGATSMPASVSLTGQVQISGVKTGSQGSLSAFTGTAVTALGLGAYAAQSGRGADVPVSGLLVQQFGRNPAAASRLQVSGSASLRVLAAGI